MDLPSEMELALGEVVFLLAKESSLPCVLLGKGEGYLLCLQERLGEGERATGQWPLQGEGSWI